MTSLNSNNLTRKTAILDLKVNDVSNSIGYEITRINNIQSLEKSLSKGLGSLYMQIFAEDPFKEKILKSEADDIFREYLDNKACILIVQNKEKQPIAFMVSEPLKAKNTVAKLLENKTDVEKALYLADDGVKQDYRRKGISAALKGLVLFTAKINGYDDTILRTNESNYSQIAAVIKSGGDVMDGIDEWVTTLRTNDRIEADRRVYYKYSSNYGAMPYETVNATILKGYNDRKSDTIYINDTISMKERERITPNILSLYQGIRSVIYIPFDIVRSQQDYKTCFEGKLPLRSLTTLRMN